MNPRVSRQIKEFILSPFSHQRKLDGSLVAVFLLINFLVFFNLLRHDPGIGYDAVDHLKYLNALSSGKLPSRLDTREFFSPPLPYALGALARLGSGLSIYKAARISQLFNGLLSMGLLFVLLKTCSLVNSKPSLRLGALTALGLLPVYYKSFTQVRGEPYLAFFTGLVLYQMVKVLLRKDWRLSQMILLGASLGLCALSRQWGFFLFPAVGLMAAWEWLRNPPLRRVIAQGLLVTFLTAILITGWFYASLYLRYGSATAFNRDPEAQFSFSNQPRSFYLGFSPGLVFSQPIRPNYPDQFWPILYSDIWGDYWGYYSVYGKDTRNCSYLSGMELMINLTEGVQEGWLETNYHSISSYLGRTNLIALFPSWLAGCGIIFAFYCLFRPTLTGFVCEKKTLAFLLLAAATTLAGYGWFLIQFPNERGDTIKATYLLHIFPYLAVLMGSWMAWIESRSRRAYLLLLAGLSVVFLHNLPAMMSHYVLPIFCR